MGVLAKSVLIGLGAAVGANLRYWLSYWMLSRGPQSFPWVTLLVNVSGSLAIGILLALALRSSWPEPWRLFLAVGLLGGYTTFSAFSWEVVQLFEAGSSRAAFTYVLLSLFACVGGCWIGAALARLASPAP